MFPSRIKEWLIRQMQFVVVQIHGDDELHILHVSWLVSENQGYLCPMPQNPTDIEAWEIEDKSAYNLVTFSKLMASFATFEAAEESVSLLAAQLLNGGQNVHQGMAAGAYNV